MSITFPTTDLKVPSGITALPSKMKRPAFGTLYGFDAQQGGGVAFSNGHSISFDGTNDYASATLGSQVFDGDFSISFWFNADTAPTYTTLIQSGSDSGYNDGFRIYRYSNTSLAFWKGQGGYSNIFGNIGTTATGSWHHIVVTRSGTTSTFYLNGSSIDTGTDSQSYTSSAFQMSFTTYPLDGLMDEVALWDSALSSANVTSIYNSGVPNDISALSPVNWWRMGDNDSGTGTTITDQGSGSNNGTLTNGPTFSPAVPPGYSIRSVDFDGTDDFLSIGDTSAIDSATVLSFSMWCKIDSVSGNGYLFGAGTSTTDGIWLVPYSDGNMYFSARNGASGYVYISNPSTGQWVHILAVFNGASPKLYVDGSLVSHAGPGINVTLSATGGDDFNIGGKWGTSASDTFNGKIDEFAYWASDQSSNIATIYNSGVPANLTSLSPVGWWRMGDGTEAGSGTTVYDMSSNSNNGTLTNGPTYSSTTP